MCTKDLKEVQIIPLVHRVIKIDTLLVEEEERELVDQLSRNVDLFARPPSDMSGINTKVVSHHLAIHPFSKLVTQWIIQNKDVKCTLLSVKLYKMRRASPMPWYICEHETALVLEEVHKGAYNCHINGKSLDHKLLRARYC